MKPTDSGEGEKRDIEDVDAPTPDGFTILDADTSSKPDAAGSDGNQDTEDADRRDGDEAPADESTGDDGDTDGAESSVSADADESDAEAEKDTDGDEAGETDTTEAAETPAAADGDSNGELSFDEWLAAAEIPTDDPKKSADDGKGADGDAAATGRGRKKNRRSRRSRKKATSGDNKSSNLDSATSADKALDTDKTTGSDASADTADDGEVVGTSMSEIMAELLAAAEQSSLERPEDDAEALDTEVELDPEATSEFASTGDGDSPKKVSAAIAAAKATSPTDDQAPVSDDAEADADSDSESDEKAANDSDESDSDETASSEKDSNDTNAKDKSSDTKDKDDGTKDADTDVKDKKSDDKDQKSDVDDKDKKSADKDTESKDQAAKDGDGKESKDGDTKEKERDSGDKDAKAEPAAASTKSAVESKTSSPTVAPLRRPEKSSNAPTAIIAIVAAVVGLYAILVVGWALDSMAHSGEPMRGVQVANVSVGGKSEEGLAEVFDTLDADLEASELTVSVDDVDINTDPFNLGVRHDREPMIDQALDARRGGFIAFRPIRWLFHLFTSENVPAQYTIDSALAAEGAEEIIGPELDPPVEPEIELRGSQMALVPGADGVAVDPDEIVDLLPAIIGGAEPYEMVLTAGAAAPTLTDDAVGDVVDEINEQTEQPILAQVLDKEVEVSPRMLKTWMVLSDEDGEPSWSIDEELALEDLKPLFPALGSEDQQARFSVVDGEPIIIPASETVICCEEGTLVSLGAAIERNIPDPIEPPEGSPEDAEPIQQLRRARLEPAITGNDEGVAELQSLGIVEEISTFTTPHACCQNRVINIQRFADLTQGVIIRPGEEFSLNEFVGQRTREKGFVADGAIVLGNFEPQVGGGISQYATTFFNASFFAGIEFLEYQSHSIYISRYPRGREATISWRRPDLKVLNNTEYGILVWNEYTDTSITVTFYSTKNREVEALPLLRSSDRQCRIDITPRVITFEDGTTQEDSVRAIYRPGQGLDCNGNSTTPEEDPPPPANNATPDPPAPDPDDDDDGEVLPPGG